ncbi:MAG TPA: ABC transporter permease subunit, partial [Spirochaetia bacterium]
SVVLGDRATIGQILMNLLTNASDALGDREGRIDVRARRVSFVFQNDALLPWRTALANVLLPFELAGESVTAELRARASTLLVDLGLVDCDDRYPNELSGGMKKRVEIARALITDPDLLILDEPFSSLDIITREGLNLLLRDLHGRSAFTAVMVTHSVEEACFLSSSVFVLSSRPGRIIERRVLAPSDDPPETYILSAAEREAAAEIRRQARELWAASSVSVAPTAPAASGEGRPDGRGIGAGLRRRLGLALIPLELVALYFLVSFLCRAIPIPSWIIPPPYDVLKRFVTTLVHGTILPDLATTAYESFVGFAAGFLVSLLLGYGIAKSRLASRLLMPWLIASNTIPTIALAPFLVLWFGFGMAPRIITSVIVIFFPMLINTISAIGLAEKSTGQLAAFFRPGRLRRFVHFELPASLPVIASGMKVSITLSVIGAVVGEFVSGERGLGALVSIARANFDVELMFVGLTWLVILGLFYYSVAVLAERFAAGGAREVCDPKDHADHLC